MKIINVKNLTKKFKDFVAVDNISFDVEEGQIFAFLGPNGAGKSTTIKMLTTLLHPSSGEININGFSILRDKDKIRHSFGIVFQDQSLDDELTAWENMYFHGKLYGIKSALLNAKITELLKFVELHDRKNSLVKTFSGGMKRRLEIARGLLHTPKIIFLDEPTLGLDPQTRNLIWGHIKKLNQKQKITVFFTTHIMEEVEKMACEVAIIDHGKIVARGNPEKLKKDFKAKTMEEAFLNITGKDLREESSDPVANLRLRRRLHR